MLINFQKSLRVVISTGEFMFDLSVFSCKEDEQQV